jgi:putative ABC transport system permease protein
VIANLLAGPVLGQTSQVFEVAPQSIPLWVDLAVPLAMLALAGIAALVPASRAGRLDAVRAIATGRAPRPAHGYAALRLLGPGARAAAPGDARPGRAVRAPGRTLVTLAVIRAQPGTLHYVAESDDRSGVTGRATGKQVGDAFTLTDDGRAVALTIAGEVFLPCVSFGASKGRDIQQNGVLISGGPDVVPGRLAPSRPYAMEIGVHRGG